MSDYSERIEKLDRIIRTQIRCDDLRKIGVPIEYADIIAFDEEIFNELMKNIVEGMNVKIAIAIAQKHILVKELSEKDSIIRKLQEENKSLLSELDKTKNTNIIINVSCDGLNNNANYISEQMVKTLKEQMKRDWLKV